MVSVTQGLVADNISYGNNRSNFRNFNVGVAEGSKLGPICINDMLKLDLIGQLGNGAALVYALEHTDIFG